MREGEQWSVPVGAGGDRIVLYSYEERRGYSSLANLVRVRADGQRVWAIGPPNDSADAWVSAELAPAATVEANS